MLDFVMKNKKAVLIIGVIIFVIVIFSGRRSAEDTAKQFAEAVMEGDAKTMVSLMSDITIEESGYKTKKLLIHALDEELENTIERYKDKYGEKWKYKVKVVDSYDVDFSDIEAYVEITDYISSHMKEVTVSIEHKGKGWLNDKEGTEDMVITCIKLGRKWYVLYFD